METVSSFFTFLFSPEHFLYLFFIFLGVRSVILLGVEHFFSHYPVEYKKIFKEDVFIMFLYLLVVFPLAQIMLDSINIRITPLSFLVSLPFGIRFILYLLLADGLHYWVHRLMHHRLFWRTHKWHHSFTHMSFMSGIRASVGDSILIGVCFTAASPVLGVNGYTFSALFLMISLLINDWMHLNISRRFPLLEKYIVTPRYHHIHHSIDPKHHSKNLSAFFPIWDRLFGTYINPDDVPEKLTFGIQEKTSKVRFVVGV